MQGVHAVQGVHRAREVCAQGAPAAGVDDLGKGYESCRAVGP